ncbi:MAG: hypothetical protein P8X79_22155 [Reinekea sp.]
MLEKQRRISEDQSMDDLTKPSALYDWYYRPDYQFSVYDLDISEVDSYYSDIDGNIEKFNVLEQDDSVIGLSTGKVDLAGFLSVLNQPTLELFDNEKILTAALGEQEIQLSISENQALSFLNVENVNLADGSDYLTARIYLNGDSENLLWQFAFAGLWLSPSIDVTAGIDENILTVSADEISESPVLLRAFIDGVQQKDTVPERLSWGLDGVGSLSPVISEEVASGFSTELKLSTLAGEKAIAYAYFQDPAKRYSTPVFETVAGEPAVIKSYTTGKTAVGRIGGIQLDLEVKDKFGNPVADGHKVDVSAEGLIIKNDKTTENGQVTVELIGSYVPGDVEVLIRSGNAEARTNVHVHDVTFNFPNLETVATDENRVITIEAKSTYGQLTGEVVDIAVHRGRLGKYQYQIDQYNQIKVPYFSGLYPGMAQLSARLQNSIAINAKEFFVIETGDYLESYELVSDASGVLNLGDGVSLAYDPSTNLVVHGEEGEVVTASMGSIFAPPLYALQDFSTDAIRPSFSDEDHAIYFDVSSGVDAAGYKVNTVTDFTSDQFSTAMQFQAGSHLEVPEHHAVNSLIDAGLNFSFKMSDVARSGNIRLINWDNYGLELWLNADDTFSLRATTSSGLVEIQSDPVKELDKWTNIAIHKKGIELFLGINESVQKEYLVTELSALDKEDYSLSIEAQGISGEYYIGNLRVYDWYGEKTAGFDDGSFSTEATVEADGLARIKLTASPSTLAYTRVYSEDNTAFFASIKNSFMPDAYAATSAQYQLCMASFTPVNPDAEDANIQQAERFMDMMLECFVKPRVEEVRIEYQTSKGFFRKSAAVVKLGVYEGTYRMLQRQKNKAVIALNCMDAIFTGDNSSAVGVTCDFITSMLAIGDMRDILFQSWHYWFGDRSKYDPLAATLAEVGLLADISMASGAPGVTANALAATGKIVNKFLKRIGPKGVAAGRVTGDAIGGIIKDGSLSREEKLKKLQKFVPLFSIGTSLTLVYQDNPKVFKFFVAALFSPDSLSNMIAWFERYFAKLSDELSLSQNRLFELFLEDVYAAGLSGKAKGTFVKQLSELVDKIDEVADGLPVEAYAVKFNEALDVFLRHVDTDDFKKVYKKLNSSSDYDMTAITAFIKVHQIGGKNSVTRLAELGGWTIGLPSFDSLKLLESIADLDVAAMQRITNGVEEVANATSGLRQITNQVNHPWFGTSKGAVAHLLVIAEVAKREGYKVKGIEVSQKSITLESGTVLPGLRVDLQVEVNGKVLDVEIKNYSAANLKGNIRKLLSDKAPVTQADIDSDVVAGQLMNQLVRYEKNGFEGRRLWLTPDCIKGFDKLTPEEKLVKIAEKRQEIADTIMTYFKDNEKEIANRYFELADLEDVEQLIKWEDVLDGLEDSLSGNGAFIDIVTFEKLL